MGAREEHSHVARVSTGLFLSRSRLDRNHSCTHSTHVLAQVETVVWWTLATFLALSSERAGLCGRKRVCQDRRWVPLCLGAECAPERRLVGTARVDFSNSCPSDYCMSSVHHSRVWSHFHTHPP